MILQDRLIDDDIAAWNETDPARRRHLVARCFAEGARYRDPRLAADGHAALATMLDGVQVAFPGHRFRRLGTGEAHHDRLRFRWALDAPGGGTVVEGTDVAVLAADGRLAEVTGFFDTAPAG